MDRKSRDYAPVKHEDYPTESQPLTRHRYSNCSETDVDGFVPPENYTKAPRSSWKYTIVAILMAIVCNIASGCFGFYYGKGDLDAVCSSYTEQYCEHRI